MAPEITTPPRSGKGSGKAPWLAFANDELGLDLGDDLKLDEIRAKVDEYLAADEPPEDGPGDDPPPDEGSEGANEPGTGEVDESEPVDPGPREVEVDADCAVSYQGQYLRLSRGQTVRGGLAAFLHRTGAPVSSTSVDEERD